MEDTSKELEDSIREYLRDNLTKEKKLSTLIEKFKVSENEIRGIALRLKEDAINIDFYEQDGETYLIRNEHPDLSQVNVVTIPCEPGENKKIAAIADTRCGSKDEQFRVLNDMFLKFHSEGITDVFVIGNVLEGRYTPSIYSKYGKSLITNDGYSQANHFIENFPHVDGINTYIISGDRDHSFSKQLNVGEYIASRRSDITYLGPISCDIQFNKVSVRMEQLKNVKAYTTSYPIETYIRSMTKSEYEKYDILMLGGEMNFQYFPQKKGMQAFSIGSVVSRTPQMKRDQKSNTIGAYTFEIEFTKEGKLKRIIPNVSTYEPVNTRYFDFKRLNLVKNEAGDLVNSISKTENPEYATLRRLYNLMKKEEDFNSLKARLEEGGLKLSTNELYGIIGRLKDVGMDIDIVDYDGGLVVQKRSSEDKYNRKVKPAMKDLHCKEIAAMSDLHYGSREAQPSAVNTFVYEAYNRGIKDVFIAGDTTHGDYAQKRPGANFDVHIFGPTGFVYYVKETLPRYQGITYHALDGNHDKTIRDFWGMDFGEKLAAERPDYDYQGLNHTIYMLDGKVPIEMLHPNDGNARISSTKIQNRQDDNPYRYSEAELSLWGHYHKFFYLCYDGVHTFLLPSLTAKTNFQTAAKLSNLTGGFFIKIYFDDNGKIHYLTPEAMVFEPSDLREDDWKKPRKYIKNKIITPRAPIKK